MTAGLQLLTPLTKSVLLPFVLTTGMTATDAAVQKKNFVSGTIALIISNEKMEDIMKIVKTFEESDLLTEGISETIKNEAKEQKRPIFSNFPMLLGILAPRLLGSALTGRGVIRAGEATIRAGKSF